MKRRDNFLKKETDLYSNKQICKGMAEIYSGILNEIGIKSKVVGALKKVMWMERFVKARL